MQSLLAEAENAGRNAESVLLQHARGWSREERGLFFDGVATGDYPMIRVFGLTHRFCEMFPEFRCLMDHTARLLLRLAASASPEEEFVTRLRPVVDQASIVNDIVRILSYRECHDLRKKLVTARTRSECPCLESLLLTTEKRTEQEDEGPLLAGIAPPLGCSAVLDRRVREWVRTCCSEEKSKTVELCQEFFNIGSFICDAPADHAIQVQLQRRLKDVVFAMVYGPYRYGCSLFVPGALRIESIFATEPSVASKTAALDEEKKRMEWIWTCSFDPCVREGTKKPAVPFDATWINGRGDLFVQHMKEFFEKNGMGDAIADVPVFEHHLSSPSISMYVHAA
jgi:hypothetical protein